jgi:hypothetical protein
MFLILIGVLIVTAILLIIFVVKNEITFNIQMKRIKEISGVVGQRINDGLGYKENAYDICTRDYDSILFNPFIWTVEQAYPESVESVLNTEE